MNEQVSPTEGAAELQLDEVDEKIVALLKENGRASNQEIARQLGITAATVGARIRRLEETNTMRIVAITDFSAAGYDLLICIGVQVQNRSATDVAEDLAALPEIFSVSLVTGVQDIEILAAAKDFDDLSELLTKKLAHIKGIQNLSPGLAVDVLKFLSDSVPLK